MIEVFKFSRAGMDQDNAPDSKDRSQNDYDEAFLLRTKGTAKGEGGNGTNYESTVKLSGPRPAGINKGAGSRAFENFRKAYCFIYNSRGYHLLVEVDHDKETETVLFTNLTDSAGVDVLRLSPTEIVTEIQLVDGIFLLFIDADRRPCCVNLERLRKKEYGVITYNDFGLQKGQPMWPVLASYGDDSSRSTNLLRGELYQFISQYVYQDYEHSAWSMISKRATPTYEGTTAIGTDVTKYNHLVLSVNIGDDRVDTINVGARTGLNIWYTIKSITRERVLAITATSINVANGIYEAYDPATNLYTFAFYNDALYNPISPLETDLLNDVIPEEAGTMEVINSNLVALSDLKEGKPRPVVDIEFTVSTFDPGLTYSEVQNADALKARWSSERKTSQGPYEQVYIWFSGLPKAGDTLYSSVIDYNDKKSIQHEYPFTVEIAEQDQLLKMVQKYATGIPYSSVRTEANGEVRLTFSLHRWTEHNQKVEVFKDIKITLANLGDGSSTSKPVLKSNSAYQAAVGYYDEFGRPFPINTDSKWVFQTPSFADLKGKAPRVDWKIKSAAPKGAVYYNIMLSENNTHEKTLFVVGKESGKSAADYITLYINPLKKFNENNQASVLSYGYTKGDRATLHYMEEDATNVRTWFDGSTPETREIDVEVLSFEVVPEEEPSTVINYQLKIRKSSSLTVASLAGKDILIELYTPRKRDAVNQSGETGEVTTPFFEIGERFQIVNGVHTQLTGSITEGDVYLKTRPYVGAIDPNTLFLVVVEDFNFSDYYPSDFYSYGRPRTYFDTPEEVELGAYIRYGEVYEKGSKLNGLTRFYLENIYGDGPGETSSSYGRIMKMTQRGGYLVVLQQINNCHLPVYKTIWEDAEGQQQVAVSTKIFGNAQYNRAGNVGIGDSRTAFAKSANGTIYFIDPNNSMPMRDGYDGLKPIPGKMSKYFQEVLHNAYRNNKNVILYCNDFQNELIVTLETDEDVVYRVKLDSASIEVLEPFTVLPGDITLLQPSTKGNQTYDNATGKANYQSLPNQLGSDNFTFQFVTGGVNVVKRACINITAGDKTVDEYHFNDVTDAELSTQYVSNGALLTGFNVPVPISITGGEFSLNGGAWTNQNGLAYPDDKVEVRGMSSGSSLTNTNVVLTVGDRSDMYTVQTKYVAPPVEIYGFVNIYNQQGTQAADYTASVNGVQVPVTEDFYVYFDASFPETVTVVITPGYGAGRIDHDIYGAPNDDPEIQDSAITPYDTRVAANYVFNVNRSQNHYLEVYKIAPTVVTFQIGYGLNPIVQNGLILMRDENEVYRSGTEVYGGATGNYFPGDVLKVRPFTYGPALPWEAGSKVDLVVTLSGGTLGSLTLYDADLAPQVIEFPSFEYTIPPEGSGDIHISSIGVSTAVGYLTKTLTTNSDTTLASVEITDTTEPKLVLNVTDTQAFNGSIYPFNVKDDANKLEAKVTNKSATNTIDVSVNGGGVITIAALGFHNFTNINKDSLTVNIVTNLPA